MRSVAVYAVAGIVVGCRRHRSHGIVDSLRASACLPRASINLDSAVDAPDECVGSQEANSAHEQTIYQTGQKCVGEEQQRRCDACDV